MSMGFGKQLGTLIVGVGLAASGAWAQRPAAKKSAPKKAPAQSAQTQSSDPSKTFALNVLQTAVSMPQPSPQDRLRVLSSAVTVASSLAPKQAKQWASEGVGIEAQLISAGEQPATSMLATGQADCIAAAEFVNKVYPANVAKAEQSLIGALSHCKAKTKELIKTRIDSALAEKVIAPRLTMAMIDAEGPKSAWSQEKFKQLFSNLPDPSSPSTQKESVNYASMFANMGKDVDKDAAKRAGLSLLNWLGKMETSGDKNLAVNITTGGLKEALGEEAYNRALESDVMARQAAQTAGAAGEVSREEEESASVLQAMRSTQDQTDELNKLPVSMRARQAAAHGFASGTSGDKRAAENYFDIAFSAANENWSERGSSNRAAEVVEEVSQAAAQVDPVSALNRAQKQLSDPTAQAIGMIAVARVVVSQPGR